MENESPRCYPHKCFHAMVKSNNLVFQTLYKYFYIINYNIFFPQVFFVFVFVFVFAF